MIVHIIDTETTGLTPQEGKLIEVAIAAYDLDCGLISAKSFLVNKNVTVEDVEKTRSIHNINPKLVMENGYSEVQDLNFMGSTLLAHNADFDRQWFNFGDDVKWVCTQKDIKWPKISNASLVATALAHGVGVVAAHRALTDVLTIVNILDRVRESQNLNVLIDNALLPRLKYKADVGFNSKHLAKNAGFNWDQGEKCWIKKMTVEEAAMQLPFSVSKIN